MMNFCPIVYFVFNRPEHTKRSLESLIKNPESKNSDIHIFVDGPRNQKDQKNINKIISIVHSYKHHFKSFTLKQNTQNKGCAKQTIDCMNEFCQIHDRFIFLEDDNVTSPFFLDFMNRALNKYENNEQVWSISGYVPGLMYDAKTCYFLPFFASWGWASWSKYWLDANWDSDELQSKLMERKLLVKFNFNGNYPQSNFLNNVKGACSSWSVRIQASMFLKNRLCLYPIRSLVQNIGTDGSGEHFTFSSTKYDTELYQNPITEFPGTIIESNEAYEALLLFYKSHKLGFWGHVKSKTKKLISIFNKLGG